MLVVRIEIWPRGDSRVLRQIDALTIVNVGATSRDQHLYMVRSGGRRVKVRHRRSDGAMKLVGLAVRALERVERTDTAPEPSTEELAADAIDWIRGVE